MNEQCKFTNANGYRCGSYAFNLYKEQIDQGDRCDHHYWQEKAMKAAAQDKLDDDAALTIAYQSGFYDGKKAAQRPWVGLTEEEFDELEYRFARYELYRAIEAKLKEKTHELL